MKKDDLLNAKECLKLAKKVFLDDSDVDYFYYQLNQAVGLNDLPYYLLNDMIVDGNSLLSGDVYFNVEECEYNINEDDYYICEKDGVIIPLVAHVEHNDVLKIVWNDYYRILGFIEDHLQ